MKIYIPQGCKWNDFIKTGAKKITEDSIGFDAISIEEGYVAVNYQELTNKFIWCNVYEVPYSYIGNLLRGSNFRVIPVDLYGATAYAMSSPLSVKDISNNLKFTERFKNKIFYIDNEPSFDKWDEELNNLI